MALSLRQLQRQSTALLRRAPQTAPDAEGPQSHPNFIEVSVEAPVGGGSGEVVGAEEDV